jgi:hypothetical protein
MKITHEGKGRPSEEKIPTVVVYKKPTGKKYYMLVTESEVDTILTPAKRKPLIPDGCDVVDIGIGKSFIASFKKQYNIK